MPRCAEQFSYFSQNLQPASKSTTILRRRYWDLLVELNQHR